MAWPLGIPPELSRPARRFVCALLALSGIPAVISAAVAEVQVQVTHRQAVITYTAPDDNPCTVAVYSDQAMTRPVRDTDTALFPGSNRDDRPGSLSQGRSRTFIAGQIPIPGWDGYSPHETASPLRIELIARNNAGVATATTAGNHNLVVNDHVSIGGVEDRTFEAADVLVAAVPSANTFRYRNSGAADASSRGGQAVRVNRFSRTLQADTAHWFRIACGGDAPYAGSFRTANLPIGSTYGELTAFDWSSAPMKYLYPAIPNTRDYEVIDPLTGILTKRATMASDCSVCGPQDFPKSFDSGAQSGCPPAKTNGGYHCTVQSNQGSNRLYWFGPDGSSRYLGHLRIPAGSEWAAGYAPSQGFWDSEDPNKAYALIQSTAMKKLVLLALQYTGNDAAVEPGASVQWTPTNLMPASAGRALPDLIREFDPAFDPAQFASCALVGVQGRYLQGSCRVYYQNSPAWLWVLDLGDKRPLGRCTDCMRVVAAAPIHANPRTRWCGHHFSNPIPSGNAFEFVVQRVSGGAAGGPWEVTLRNPDGVDASAAEFQMDGEPVYTTPSPLYMQDAQAGDVFIFLDGTNERVKIVEKRGTAWTVRRGYGGIAARPHAAGAKLRAVCEPIELNLAVDHVWRFLDDPRGRDTSNLHWIQDTVIQNVHRVERDPYNIGAGWVVRKGPFPSQNFDGPHSFAIPASPRFAGVFAGADGNSYQKHPSYENWNAPAPERRSWFVDVTPFQSSPVLYDAVSKVADAQYIFKYAQNPSFPRDFKRAPYFGLSGTKPLLDVSGPGSRLEDSAADRYKMCAVYRDGECRPGSRAGEVYANLPEDTQAACSGGETYGGRADFCAFHVAAYGQAVVQFGLDDPNITGALHTRVLMRGLAGAWRQWSSLTNARALPDGEWLIVPTQIFDDATSGEQALLLAKVPPMPEPGADLSGFVSVPLAIPGRQDAMRTIVEFGYDPSGRFQCTQRRETCVADSMTFDLGNPFKFAETDEVGGVECSAGCTVSVPAIAGRVMYYRWKHRAANGAVLETGPVKAVSTSPGLPASAEESPVRMRRPGSPVGTPR